MGVRSDVIGIGTEKMKDTRYMGVPSDVIPVLFRVISCKVRINLAPCKWKFVVIEGEGTRWDV